ncbi:MAG TPA: M28 family peptidase [Acidobacteriota bacterium]|nr:M28 family peptidase [Acidobacteriota bacterium]
MWKKVLPIAIAIPAIFSGFLLADETARDKAAASITIDELRDHLYYLASDALEGRMPGEPGYRIAAEYSATQFRAAGLEVPDFGKDTPAFLQPVPLQRTDLGPDNYIKIIRGGKEEKFEHGEKYLLFHPGKEDISSTPLAPLFLGYGISEPEYGWDDLAGHEIEGRFVLIMLGVPGVDGKPVLPDEINKEYADQFRGMFKKVRVLVEKGAGGIVIVPNLEIAMAWNMLHKMLGRMSISLVGSSDRRGMLDFPVPVIIAHANLINAMFEGRGYDPLGRKGKYGTFELDDAEFVLNIDVEKVSFDSPNVVAIVHGSDPQLRDEYITVGAHLDHIGVQNGKVFNGADDNASGCVAILEAAEAVAISPPRRSVIFILYTAEEIGLYGSTYFVANTPVPLEQVVVNINLDMVGRSDSEPPGLLVIGSQEICGELKTLVIGTNEKRVNAELNFTTDESDPLNYFNRSDHINFHRNGIPVVFLSCGEHNDYHTPNDDVEKIDFKRLRSASLLTYELVMELGNRDERICTPK